MTGAALALGPPTAAQLIARTVLTSTGCAEWTGARDADGYPSVSRRIDGRTVHYKAARIVLAEMLGRPLTDAECALHRCDNPPCIERSHLFVGTKGDNSRDMMSKGRGRQQLRPGAANRNAKLTDADVRAIRASYAAGSATLVQLGEQYGVHHSAVSRIVNRRQYADVT